MMGLKRVRSAHVAAQRAAEGDVQFLQAPANPEHRLAEVETGGNEVRGHGVAIRVVRPFGIGRIAFAVALRSEEHTSELQSLMRISYAVFCLKKQIIQHSRKTTT